MKLKTILIFAIIAFLLVHIIGFIRFGELTFYWEYFEDNLTANSSIDPLIARIMSIVFGLIALLVAPYFFSLKFNKFFVFACCYGLWLIINTVMMIIYPDITDCKQCMALNPTTSEYEFFNCPRRKPDLHKKYGTKVYCAGYPNQRIIPNDNTIYFTNNGGEPLLWYFVNDAGQYEIFNQRGNHLKFGTALKEITPETAKIIEYLRLHDPGMILGTNALTKAELNKISIEKREKDSLTRLEQAKIDFQNTKRQEELSFTFSRNSKWSTVFELREKTSEFEEPNTRIRFLCTSASDGGQFASFTIYYPNGENEELSYLNVGKQHIIECNNYKLRLYILKVLDGYDRDQEDNDIPIIKLENIPNSF